MAATLVFVAIVLGGLTAHVPGANSSCPGFPLCTGSLLPTDSVQALQWFHRIVAFAVFFHLGWLGVVLTRRGEPRMAAAARLLLTLVFAQIVIAATMIAFRLPALWRSLHEAVGTLLWIVVFAAAYVARRQAHATPVVEPAGGPARRPVEARA